MDHRPGPDLPRTRLHHTRRACDIDHTTRPRAGGPTSHDNLGLLCRHHHRLKHEGGWTLTQPKPGTFQWQSPAGNVYRQ